MAAELIYIANVDENGTLKIVNRKQFDEDIKSFAGKRLVIKVRKQIRSRTVKQNNFYWGNFIQSQIDAFKERWGYTYNKVQIHEWNKANFWSDDHMVEETGEVFKLPASSTDNSTVTWEEKMENIRSWFMEHMDWALPYPEQQSELEL